MKRISEENIENLMPVADGYAYYRDFAKAVVQDQLEADRKAMRDLFEEIEGQGGVMEFIDMHDEEWWKALKDKFLKEE